MGAKNFSYIDGVRVPADDLRSLAERHGVDWRKPDGKLVRLSLLRDRLRSKARRNLDCKRELGELLNRARGASPKGEGEMIQAANGAVDSAAIGAAVAEAVGGLKGALLDVVREVGAGDPEKVRPLVAQELEKLAPRRLEIVKPDGERKEIKGAVPEIFEELLEQASMRIHSMLVGPTGCGKTYIAEKIAEALDLQFAAVSCSAGMSESALEGWLVPGEGGAFEYRETPFIRCYRDGGVFLFDEIDAADANLLCFVNAALANGGIHIPKCPDNGGYIERHPDFICICAANTWGTGADAQYVGRAQLDEATLDRFRAGRIFMDYDRGVEDKLVRKDVVTWAREIRRKIREHRIRRTCSMRFCIDISKMADAYPARWAQQDTWERKLCVDWSEDEKSRMGIDQ